MKNEAGKPMPDELCKDLLGTLKEMKHALELRDPNKLKDLSDHTIHSSSIYHEKRAIYLAMIAYSLSKIIEKGSIKRKHKIEFNDFLNGMVENFGAMINFLEQKEFEKFNGAIKSILKEISEFDSSFGKYAESILEFSKIQNQSLEFIYKNYSKIIPTMGKFIIGEKEPYEYLVKSIENFVNQDELIDLMKKNGFQNCTYRNLSGGIVSIHSGWKI